MKTDNLHLLLMPLKGDYWLFQVLWMNEKCRGLKKFTASNTWDVIIATCPTINTHAKVVWLCKEDDIIPRIIPQNNTTFEEIEQALTEWSAWADTQIGKVEKKEESDNPYIIKV